MIGPGDVLPEEDCDPCAGFWVEEAGLGGRGSSRKSFSLPCFSSQDGCRVASRGPAVRAAAGSCIEDREMGFPPCPSSGIKVLSFFESLKISQRYPTQMQLAQLAPCQQWGGGEGLGKGQPRPKIDASHEQLRGISSPNLPHHHRGQDMKTAMAIEIHHRVSKVVCPQHGLEMTQILCSNLEARPPAPEEQPPSRGAGWLDSRHDILSRTFGPVDLLAFSLYLD